MSGRSYLDSGSSSPLHPAAREAFEASLDTFGDPLRLHAEGRNASSAMDESRQVIADALSAQPDEIVLTSGGTESVALALRGVARASGKPGDRIVVSAVEHPSVLGAAACLEADGFQIVVAPVDGFGRLDLDVFVAEVRRPDTLLASVQHSNHEVGTLQPVAEAARLSREAGVLFHTDACQSVGRLGVDPRALAVDLLTLSGHKFGGIGGTGALYVRRGVPVAGCPYGDDRERHRRSGAENVPGIAAMAAALKATQNELADEAARQWSLTRRVRDSVQTGIEGALVHGHPTQRAPHLACFSVPGTDPEALMMALDDRGYSVGIGSFSSGFPHDPSSVLEAMGMPGTFPVRIGVGRDTQDDEIDAFLSALPDLVSELRKMEAASSDALSRQKGTTP